MADAASISIATRSDARPIVTLRAAVARDMTQRFGTGPWSAIACRAEVVRQLRASHVLVARQDDELVGTVRLARALPGVLDSSAFTPVEHSLYVLGLAVAPGRRGRGVGRQLMEAAKAAARSRGADALWLDAYDHPAGAGAFYLKTGFRDAGRTHRGEIPLRYLEWLTGS
ncbi:MAG TPA: GNAT family N-acetyltransferase [Steroidobacteraceae bacterium]|nr:GNAT family N-acetyltransferase [Steroidobacteraceae bacterium]